MTALYRLIYLYTSENSTLVLELDFSADIFSLDGIRTLIHYNMSSSLDHICHVLSNLKRRSVLVTIYIYILS